MAEVTKVLIATDGSAYSSAAVEDLALAGLPERGEALVLSVAELWLPPPTSFGMVDTGFSGTDALIVGAQVNAGTTAARVREMFPKWDVLTDVQIGGPARCILSVADSFAPQLIVVGSHGHSALGRLLLGSVSQKVVTDAGCSVRVGRQGAGRNDGTTRLLVAMKDTPGSDAALAQVSSRSWPHSTEVRLFTAFGPYEAFGEKLEPILSNVRELHAGAIERLRAAGLEASSIVSEGDPRKGIIDVAEAWQADTVFIGTRDLNRTGRRLLGSVSTAVVNRAHCSVEVCRS